jgi:hypothetical protein
MGTRRELEVEKLIDMQNSVSDEEAPAFLRLTYKFAFGLYRQASAFRALGS